MYEALGSLIIVGAAWILLEPKVRRLSCRWLGHSERTYPRYMKDCHWHLFCWRCSADLGIIPEVTK